MSSSRPLLAALVLLAWLPGCNRGGGPRVPRGEPGTVVETIRVPAAHPMVGLIVPPVTAKLADGAELDLSRPPFEQVMVIARPAGEKAWAKGLRYVAKQAPALRVICLGEAVEGVVSLPDAQGAIAKAFRFDEPAALLVGQSGLVYDATFSAREFGDFVNAAQRLESEPEKAFGRAIGKAEQVVAVGAKGSEQRAVAFETRSEGLYTQPRALPSGPFVRTEKVLAAARRQWLDKVVVEGYERQGDHAVAWDPAARKLVAAVCDYWAGVTDDGKALIAAAAPLAKVEAKDPLVLHALGEAYYADQRFKEAAQAIRSARPLYEKSEYSQILRWRFRLDFASFMKAVVPQGRGNDRWINYYEGPSPEPPASRSGRVGYPEGDYTIKELLADPQPAIAVWFLFPARLSAYGDLGGTDLPPGDRPQGFAESYVGHMFEGYSNLSLAWTSLSESGRGLGVSEADGQQQIRTAADHFEAAYRLHPEDPEAATRMIECGTYVKNDPRFDLRTWFDRAVAAVGDYGWAYAAYLDGFGGAHGRGAAPAVEFGLECLRSELRESDVPEYLWYAVQVALKGESLKAFDEERTARKLASVVPALQELVTMKADLAKQNGDEEERRSWESLGASIAYLTADDDALAKRIAAVGGKLDEATMLATAHRSAAHVKADLAARGASGEVAKGRAAEQEGQFGAAREFYRAAKAARHDAKLDAFLDQRLKLMALQVAYNEGQWVSLPLDPALTGWQVLFGQAAANGQAIEMKPGGARVALTHDLLLGPYAEVEGVCELPVEEAVLQLQIGTSWIAPGDFGPYFNLAISFGSVMWMQPGVGDWQVSQQKVAGKHFRFRFVHNNHKASLYVDERAMAEDVPHAAMRQGHLYLSVDRPRNQHHPLIWTGLRARKLPSASSTAKPNPFN